MTDKRKYLMLSGNIEIISFAKSLIVLCLVALIFSQNPLVAQVISNTGAAVSVTPGIVVNSKDIDNTSGSIGNYGIINLTGNYTSTATTTGNGTFRIGSNWTNTGGTFSGLSTVIFNGSDNQAIIRAGGETFYNLSIENSGAAAAKSVDLSNNVTVTGILSMHLGNVNTAANVLLLSNQVSSSLNYTSVTGSRIFGKFERGINETGTYLFPLGTSSNYNPANLITNSVPSPGTVLSEFLTSPAPGNVGLPVPDPPVEVDSAYVDGYWSLTAANGFSIGDFSINLKGTGFTSEPIRDITRIIKRTNGGNWFIDGTHSDASGVVVYRNNLTGNISSTGSGTQFALGKANPLITSHPVSLVVCEKTNPVFSVTATGTAPLTYIWYKNGIAITNGPHYSGARTNTLTIINAVLSDAGSYYCVVRDRDRNTTTSNSATLTVNKIPVATVSQPAQNHECSGIAFDNIVLGESYGVPGTTYIWSRTNPTGITSPVPLSGTALNIGDALSGFFTNTTDAPIVITFTITPVGPNPTYCVGIPITATVTVNPTPRVIPVMSQICYNGTTSITLISPSTMTQQGVIRFDYNITATAPPAIVGGNRTPAFNVAYNTILARQYTNESDTLQSVFFNITPTVPALGCPSGVEKPFEVKVHPKPLQNLIITTPLTCDGGSDAALRAITSKGSGPYYFDWYRTSVDNVHGYSIPDLVNRRGGFWQVTVTDNLNCKTGPQILPVEGASLSSSLFVNDTTGYGTTCPGSNDGQITVSERNASTGIAPFEYWVVRNPQTTNDTIIHDILPATNVPQTWSNLLPGNYRLYLYDKNGCTNDPAPEKPIIEPDIITVTYDAVRYQGGYNVSCKGYNDGSVWIKTITGGNKGYTYQWYAASGLPLTVSTTTSLLDSVSAGKYYLRTTDRKGCEKTDSVTLTEPDGLQLASSVLSMSPDGNTNIPCNGGNNGSISLNITGGSGIYTYSWSTTDGSGLVNGQKDQLALTAGTYETTVTDNNGCVLRLMPGSTLPRFTLTEPTAVSVTSSTSISDDGSYNINCYGGTGSILISATGGSTMGTYTYTWSTTDGSGLVSGQKDQYTLTAGVYHLVVKDANNCPDVKDITLIQPSEVETVLIPSHITCQSASFSNGSINLTVSGGVAPYAYSWSNGESTEDIAGLTEGYYKVTVTDDNGCPDTDSVRVNLPPPLNYTTNMSDYNGYNISCNGLANGYIEINPSSGLAPFVYTWTGPDEFNDTIKDILNLKAGEYHLLITDSNYCTATETINLTEPGILGMTFNLSSSIAGGYNINCAGDNTGSIGIEPLNQVKTVEYLWSDGLFGKTRMNLPAGEYNIIIIDANNCQAGSTITLTEPDSMKLIFDITQPFCPDKPDGEIRFIDITGGVRGADYSYKWSDNSTNRNLSNIPEGFYKVIITDMNSCSISDSIYVEPLNETCLIIPNAISPNDDQINDVWNIGMIELYPGLEIKIFNRWGEIIWRSEKGYPHPWDGRSNGAPLPIDSYHYIIDLHNGSKPLIGNVTIVR
jgi:gliding motility-associated-like protein